MSRCKFSISFIVLGLWLVTDQTARGEITRGPYIQLAHETGMTIVWRSGTPMKSPRVHYWKQKSNEITIVEGDAILSRTTQGEQKLHSAPVGAVQYEATITGLEPATTYEYAVYDEATRFSAPGGVFHFTTHPPIGTPAPARVWVVGDSGTGQAHQRMVHESMRKYTKDGKRTLDFYLHVGDMAYGQGTDEQFQTRFFEPYQLTLRNTVCWASMGNHEGATSRGKTGIGPYYDAYVCPTEGEAGGTASGTEAYYSFDYGNIHFICLNSHDLDRTPEGEMAKWLKRDLASTKALWIIGFWHHPPYTKGTHDSDSEIQLIEMRKYIMPILEEGGVDLVLSGHSHIYERSMLIDRAYDTPTSAEGVVLDDGDGRPDGDGAYRKSGKITPHNGTVALVTGHGGALGRNNKGIMPIMRSIVLDHGSTILDFEGDTMTGTMLDLHGKERDKFAITKRGEVKHTVVEDPWTPDPTTAERTGNGVLGAAGTLAEARRAELRGEKHIPTLIPKKHESLIPPNDEWFYLDGGEQPETEMWTKLGFDPKEEGWKSGRAGFGYGDGDDRTEIKDMRGKYRSIYVRKQFEIPKGTNLNKIGLAINYDDAFVLHVNGREILSKYFVRGKDGSNQVGSHEASGIEYYSLSEFADAFVEGENVVALEGHNTSLTSSDLSLDPQLLVETE